MPDDLTDEELDRRRSEMRNLSPAERQMLIALGILAGKVIDGRPHFARGRITVTTSYEDMA